MAELDHDAGSSLIDVTDVSLTDLAMLDDDALDASVNNFLPQHARKYGRSCAGSASRLWQNYDAES